jgi:hypothetical protein
MLLALALAFSPPATAVIILDSTWAEEGGDEDDPAAGFGAAIALAGQPQFDALVALASNGGDGWGTCSGTWIGNDADHGYVLTAAHCFSEEAPAEDFRVRSRGGSEFEVVDAVIHEDWWGGDLFKTGYDIAILVLDAPVHDAGRPPTLYGGDEELGQLLTFMGYGSRGIASIGEDPNYHDGEATHAAAQGLVAEVKSQGDDDGDDEDTGNYLGVFLPAEDGSIENPYGGAMTPSGRLAGLLGSGDSGGPAFLQVGGRWVVAGVNSNGSGNAEAGQTSWFVRVSGKRDWILSHVPTARFVPRGERHPARGRAREGDQVHF